MYVLLDFNNTVMMLEVQPGFTLKFVGLEMFRHYDTVGPTVKPIRMSPNAFIEVENCITRRRAGLPYEAALVNMVNATRPVGAPGPQVCNMIHHYTYKSTRSQSPITVPSAVSQYDYAMTLPPDSSLAYQGLLYGSYTYTALRSVYIVDNAVSFDCMKQRPGTECVTLLLQQLDGQGKSSGTIDEEGDGSGNENTTTIVVAVVVPTVVGLLAVLGTVLFVRHRRLGRSVHMQTGQASSDVEAPGKNQPSSSLVHDSGCVFLGLEENQQLPEWSPLAADVDEDRDDDGTSHSPHATDTGRLGGEASGQLTGSINYHQRRAAPVSMSDCVSGARGSGLLRPALSTQVDDRGTGGNGAGGGGGGEAAGLNAKVHGENDGRIKAGEPGPPGAAAAAAEGPASNTVASNSHGPAPDLMAELGRLAQELRANVKDEAIKLEAVIGSGSFGTVYRGTWQGLPVAVKTLVFSASDESRRRALQEAALCASISHPNVVATYSSDLQPLGILGSGPLSAGSPPVSGGASGERELSHILEWRLYIVQEYADGGPLRKLYGNKALWPAPGVAHLPAVVGLALGIARALAHLHSKRIIHGDLNPNNVLLKRDPVEPSGFAVKVGDFGLSVMLPQNRTHLSNLRMGTMFYICPAVVMKGQVGPSSDVFSLGVMLWELYHGRRAGIRTDQGPRYSSVFPAFPPSCPEAYRAVALHCLQRQPQNRPSAALVEAHLEQLLVAVCVASADAASASARAATVYSPAGSPAAAAAAAVSPGTAAAAAAAAAAGPAPLAAVAVAAAGPAAAYAGGAGAAGAL